MQSNEAWGEATPDLQASLDERGYQSLPAPGESELLDAFCARKNITHRALARIGARWRDNCLHYIGPNYIKHRSLTDDRKFNDVEYRDFSQLKIARADSMTQPDVVLVAEGETDAAWLCDHYPQCDVAITPSGADSIATDNYPRHVDQLMKYKTVVVALDHDEAGQRNAVRLLKVLPGALSMTPPPEGADWCAFNEVVPLPARVSRFMSARDFIVADLPDLKSYLSGSLVPVGGQLVIHGAAKNYKSYLAFDLGARLATGRGWAGHDFTGDAPIRFGVVQYEIRPGYYQDRVKALLESIPDAERQALFLDNFLTLDALSGTHLTVDDKAALSAFYREVEDADLQVVLLDPVRQMMADKDLNSEQDVSLLRAMINPLKDMGVTVILTHHDNKEYAQRGSGNPLGMTGSGAFAGDADTIVSIALPHGVGAEHTAQCHVRDMHFMLRNAPSPEPSHFEFVPETDEQAARFEYQPGRAAAGVEDGQLVYVRPDGTDSGQPEI